MAAMHSPCQRSVIHLALLLLIPIALLLTACQSSLILQNNLSGHLSPTKQHVLVTFARSAGDDRLLGGSARSYHAGQTWLVPLTIRKKITRLEKAYAIEEVTTWPIETLSVHCAVFAVDQNTDITTILDRLQREPDVVGAQVLNEFTLMGAEFGEATAKKQNDGFTSGYNDPDFELQYGDYANEVRELHKITRGKSAKVGLVDTQVDLTHPDLQAQNIVQHLFVDDEAVPASHGTAMAGIIAAAADNHIGLVGLAPEAKLLVYAACRAAANNRPQCNSINLIQALEQAIHDDVQVLNLSLAGPYDPLIAQLLAVAHRRNMIVVAAINRAAPDKSFPASLPTVVGVAELNNNEKAVVGGGDDFVADWIMRGEKLSTRAGGGYQFFYGSSVAAASVSSVAALLQASGADGSLQASLEGLIREPCVRSSQHNDNQILRYMQSANRCGSSAAPMSLRTASDNSARTK